MVLENTDFGDALIQGELRDEGLELLTREEPALRRIILRYVKDHSITDDLFQDISLKVLRRFHTVRDRRTVRSWIFQVARNSCLDYLRSQKSKPHASDIAYYASGASGDLGRNPAERFLSNERVEAIYKSMEALPASQRDVLRLRLEEGMDHLGISEKLGISRQAVEVRLCRARATIKSQLSSIYEGDL
jgi:RNA polymerase sigma-70 factor (ECF subfamily)